MAGHRVTIELDEETAAELDRLARETGQPAEELASTTFARLLGQEQRDRALIRQGLHELDTGQYLDDSESRALLKRLAE